MVASKRPVGSGNAAAKYAWASLDNLLVALADEIQDRPDQRIYLERGQEIAVLTRVDDQLVLDFLPPRSPEMVEKVAHAYARSPGRDGWLRFRRPATRDPRPALEANLGSILGTAWRERNPPPSFRSILASGGGYVGMPLSAVPSWEGAGEQALGAPDTASILPIEGGWALVLRTPDPLYSLLTPTGALLVRAVSHSIGDAALEQLLGQAPSDGWERVGEVAVAEPVRTFDFAEFGGAIGDGNSLTLALPPGTYAVAHRTWQPDDETELLLVRFARA